ncbi:MAG: hypothetical protein VKK04_20580 [Synechococcales bacterium]|nr:hypothetical protein [Synechococcales bacterium]
MPVLPMQVPSLSLAFDAPVPDQPGCGDRALSHYNDLNGWLDGSKSSIVPVGDRHVLPNSRWIFY